MTRAAATDIVTALPQRGLIIIKKASSVKRNEVEWMVDDLQSSEGYMTLVWKNRETNVEDSVRC